MTASERRSEIICILVARRFVTIQRLANELSVSSRTIMHDIVILTAHYPIDTLRGRSGGVKLAEWYNPYCGLFSAEQQLVLVNLLSKADEYEREVILQMLREYGTPDFSE